MANKSLPDVIRKIGAVGLFYGSPTTRIDGNRSKDRTFFYNSVMEEFMYLLKLCLTLNSISTTTEYMNSLMAFVWGLL